MDNFPTSLNPHTLAQLEGLELKARLIVEGYVSGLHASPYHGFSIEFAEHREYVPGDDLRYVDWKVFGKSDRFYLKQYEEETNFACHVLLDTSDSMRYRSPEAAMSKLDYAKCLAAALSYLVLRQQDAIGITTFDTEVRQFVRASSQPSHLKQICHTLEHSPAAGETAMGPLFHDLAERIRKRGVVIVLSDFFDDVETLLLGLKHFRHRRHDVLCLQIIDPAEQEFPFQDPTLFKGLEHEPETMTDPRALRSMYRVEFEQFLQDLQRGCRDLQMDYALVRTDQPFDLSLKSCLSGRARSRRRS